MTVVIPALAEESLNPYLFLRTEIDPEQTFKSLLFQEKQSLMDAYKHHYFSIRRLSELLGEEAAQSVFRVALHMQGLHREEFITSLSSNPNNELVFSFAQTDGLIKGKVLYRLGSFDEATICRITEWFIQLFMQVMSSMERPIQEYEYITSEEKIQSYMSSITQKPTIRRINSSMSSLKSRRPKRRIKWPLSARMKE